MVTELNTHLEVNDAQVITEMFNEMDNWSYGQIQIEIREKLRRMFLKYNTLESLSRERLDKLVFQHKQYCSNSRNTSHIRQHNTFAIYYINDIPPKRVAVGQGINCRTVFKDLDAVLDRMMIFLLGFYGVRWDRR